MPDKKFQNIQTILNSLLSNYGIKTNVINERIIQEWNNLIGDTLAKQCWPVKIENGVIFLKTKNSVWKNELSLKQMEFLDIIRKKYGKNIINKIQFI